MYNSTGTGMILNIGSPITDDIFHIFARFPQPECLLRSINQGWLFQYDGKTFKLIDNAITEILREYMTAVSVSKSLAFSFKNYAENVLMKFIVYELFKESLQERGKRKNCICEKVIYPLIELEGFNENGKSLFL